MKVLLFIGNHRNFKNSVSLTVLQNTLLHRGEPISITFAFTFVIILKI